MYKRNTEYVLSLFRLWLWGTLVLKGVEQLCYDTRLQHLMVRMGYYVLTAGLVFTVGVLFYALEEKEIRKADVLRMAGELFFLYIISGVSDSWFINDLPRIQSLTRVLVFRNVPSGSEIYASFLILLGLVWVIRKPLTKMLEKPWIS